MTVHRTAHPLAAVTLWLAAMLIATPATSGVTLQLTPATQTVAPGVNFDVKLRVTAAGSAFNAFHAVVVYDPTMVTPVALSPLRSQIDSVVTAACGSAFHQFHYGNGRDSIDVSMLCNGASATGPGAIYHLRFHAGSKTGRTGLYFGPGLAFANEGLAIGDLNASGCTIGIGVPVLDAGPAGPGGVLALSAQPNPAFGGRALEFGAALPADGEVTVHDLQGRLVFRRTIAAGARSVAWDGRDGEGRALAPGLYLAALRCGEQVRHARITQLR